MKNVFILFGILLLILVGCNKVDETAIQSIRLECADLCKDGESSQMPFTEKTFEDADEIKIFERAMNKAEKMNDELDYGTYFLMYVSYEDGSQKKYVLNISNSEKEGIKGLLVDTADSGQGYSIPEELHNELRILIYHE